MKNLTTRKTKPARSRAIICVSHDHSDAYRQPGYKSIRTQETGRDEAEPLSCTFMAQTRNW